MEDCQEEAFEASLFIANKKGGRSPPKENVETRALVAVAPASAAPAAAARLGARFVDRQRPTAVLLA